MNPDVDFIFFFHRHTQNGTDLGFLLDTPVPSSRTTPEEYAPLSHVNSTGHSAAGPISSSGATGQADFTDLHRLFFFLCRRRNRYYFLSVFICVHPCPNFFPAKRLTSLSVCLCVGPWLITIREYYFTADSRRMTRTASLWNNIFSRRA